MRSILEFTKKKIGKYVTFAFITGLVTLISLGFKLPLVDINDIFLCRYKIYLNDCLLSDPPFDEKIINNEVGKAEAKIIQLDDIPNYLTDLQIDKNAMHRSDGNIYWYSFFDEQMIPITDVDCSCYKIQSTSINNNNIFSRLAKPDIRLTTVQSSHALLIADRTKDKWDYICHFYRKGYIPQTSHTKENWGYGKKQLIKVIMYKQHKFFTGNDIDLFINNEQTFMLSFIGYRWSKIGEQQKTLEWATDRRTFFDIDNIDVVFHIFDENGTVVHSDTFREPAFNVGEKRTIAFPWKPLSRGRNFKAEACITIKDEAIEGDGTFTQKISRFFNIN